MKKHAPPTEFEYILNDEIEITLLAPTIGCLTFMHSIYKVILPFLNKIDHIPSDDDKVDRSSVDIDDEHMVSDQQLQALSVGLLVNVDTYKLTKLIEKMIIRHDLLLIDQKPAKSNIFNEISLEISDYLINKYIALFVLPLLLVDSLDKLEYSLLNLMEQSNGGLNLTNLHSIPIVNIGRWFRALSQLNRDKQAQLKKKR